MRRTLLLTSLLFGSAQAAEPSFLRPLELEQQVLSDPTTSVVPAVQSSLEFAQRIEETLRAQQVFSWEAVAGYQTCEGVVLQIQQFDPHSPSHISLYRIVNRNNDPQDINNLHVLKYDPDSIDPTLFHPVLGYSGNYLELQEPLKARAIASRYEIFLDGLRTTVYEINSDLKERRLALLREEDIDYARAVGQIDEQHKTFEDVFHDYFTNLRGLEHTSQLSDKTYKKTRYSHGWKLTPRRSSPCRETAKNAMIMKNLAGIDRDEYVTVMYADGDNYVVYNEATGLTYDIEQRRDKPIQDILPTILRRLEGPVLLDESIFPEGLSTRLPKSTSIRPLGSENYRFLLLED